MQRSKDCMKKRSYHGERLVFTFQVIYILFRSKRKAIAIALHWISSTQHQQRLMEAGLGLETD
jgi:hypothetical protein